MRKIQAGFLLSIAMILLLSGTAQAKNVGSAGNKYDFADSVIADSPVEGDYFAAGNTIKLEAGVKGDILAVGRNIIITDNNAVQNIFAAGQNVSVRAKSVRNIYATGGDVIVNNGTTSSGAYLCGTTVIFGGITNDAYLAAPEVTVDGTIYDQLVIRSDRITFGKNVTVNGHVTIYGTVKPSLPSNIDAGKVTFKRVMHAGREGDQATGGISRMKVITAIVGVVTAVVLALLMTLLRGGFFKARANELGKGVWKPLLWGFLALIVVPVGALCCMLTVIALPVGVIALMLYSVLLYLSPVVSGVVLGRRLLPKQNRYLTAALGAAVIELLLLVPFLRVILFLVCAFYTLGITARGLKPRREHTGENRA